MNPFVIAFRRIIYSIPLKRLLLGLAVFGVLFASFSNAEEFPTNAWDGYTELSSNGYWITNQSVNNSSSTYYTLRSDVQFVCLRCPSSSTCSNKAYSFDGSNWSNLSFYSFMCTDKPFYTKGGEVFIFPILKEWFILPQQYNSLQCQTEYSLIPIDSVDQNYCTTNNLCPSSSPSDCPNVGVSNLYINDLFHPGAFNIIMNIPEEIDWDYAYTNSGQNFNLDVVGYNQDFEKIEGWIQTNNYKPTSEDFTNIFKNFSNFGGLLVGALFVILVFYFVKKMFK